VGTTHVPITEHDVIGGSKESRIALPLFCAARNVAYHARHVSGAMVTPEDVSALVILHTAQMPEPMSR